MNPYFKTNENGTTDFIMQEDDREIIYKDIVVRDVHNPFVDREPNETFEILTPIKPIEIFLNVGFNCRYKQINNLKKIK